MDSSNSGDSTDLDDLLAVIQARKWTFLLMFIVALATMAVLSYRKTPLYEAQARTSTNLPIHWCLA
jgi:uncharacterized protein involved in exopolysaccharide biosynthesis